MKKAKIILTAITMFAVVAGALAFKAKKGNVVYCMNMASQGCSIAKWDYTITTGEGIETRCTKLWTTAKCEITKITVSQ